MFSHLLQAFLHQVKTRPEQSALVVQSGDQTHSLSWSQLAVKVVSQVDSLNRMVEDHSGVPQSGKPSSGKCSSCKRRSVGYASDNTLGDVLMALACPLAGVMEVPVDHRLGIEMAKRLADRMGGHWLEPHSFADDFPAEIDCVVERLELDSSKIVASEPALILWTSGTTEQPKAVTLTHRNLLLNATAKLAAVPNRSDDMRLTSLPVCHAYARTCDLGTWLLSGCTLALGLGFDAWTRLGPSTRPTVANTVPSLADRLFHASAESVGIDRLKLLGCGGAAMSPQAFGNWKARGVTVIQGYGLTETSPVICSATPGNATAGLVGDFVDDWEADIRDGRLFVRGPHLMSGYWDDAAATEQKIVDGWFDTGDLVEIDLATGQLRVLGRADDVLVLENGHKVHPGGIEKQIERVPGVRHAMIVASGRSIQVWLDAERSDSLLARIQDALSELPKWELPVAVGYFDRPLSIEAGELTVKGTIRRQVLLTRVRDLSDT